MNFKKTLLAAATFALSASAMAGTLTITGGSIAPLTSFSGISTAGYTSTTNDATKYDLGATLSLDHLSNVTFTFMGREAAYVNKLFTFGSGQYTNAVAVNTSVSFNYVTAGVLDFGFQSNSTGPVFTNPSVRIAFMKNASSDKALALFNDAGWDSDYDDMGVQISVTSVPEPESYAMLLAGLGLMGTIVRRDRKSVV